MESRSRNDQRNAEIIRLRQSGMFPSDIAKLMGMSRNAVIGVCYRAGVVRFDRSAAIKAHAARGIDHGRNKLSQEQVATIRRLKPFLTAAALADQFGVSSRTIECIVSRKTWKHVA